MKLTEAKLKQMIFEMMSQSNDYYNKIKALLYTEEGFLQAQSLFEMVESTLQPQEARWIKSYFEPVEIARELSHLQSRVEEAREKYNKIEDELISGASSDMELDRAHSEMTQAEIAHHRKKSQFNKKMTTMLQHGGSREIYDVVSSISKKILRNQM